MYTISLTNLKVLLADRTAEENPYNEVCFGPLEARRPGCWPRVTYTLQAVTFSEFANPIGLSGVIDFFNRLDNVIADTTVYVVFCPFRQFVRFMFALD